MEDTVANVFIVVLFSLSRRMKSLFIVVAQAKQAAALTFFDEWQKANIYSLYFAQSPGMTITS